LKTINNKNELKTALWYVGIVLLVSNLFQIVIVKLGGSFSSGTYELSDLQNNLLFVCMFIPAIILGIFKLTNKIQKKSLGMWPIRPLYCLLSFGIMLLFVLVTFLALLPFSEFSSIIVESGKLRLNGFSMIIAQPNSLPVFIVNILISMLFASIISVFRGWGEEIGWRGYVAPIFEKHFGEARGTILLSVLWAIFHAVANLAGYNFNGSTPWFSAFILMPLNCIALGAILAWLRKASGSVWPAAMGHASINVMGLFIDTLLPKISPNIFYLIMCAIQVAISIFFFFLLTKPKKPTKVV